MNTPVENIWAWRTEDLTIVQVAHLKLLTARGEFVCESAVKLTGGRRLEEWIATWDTH